MERKDTKIILERIKNNYQEFKLDDYTITEWYKELKDYDIEDVMNKLEQHFRSEQFGSSIPKVYFLTKYLTKQKDKNKKLIYYTNCKICDKEFRCDEIEEHYRRCSSIEYILNVCEKFNLNKPDKEKLYELTNEQFKKYYYNKILNYVYENTNNLEEKKRIENIIKNSI